MLSLFSSPFVGGEDQNQDKEDSIELIFIIVNVSIAHLLAANTKELRTTITIIESN